MWSYLIVFHKIWEKGVFIICTPTQLTIQHLPELVMQHIKKCLTRIYLKHVGERFSCGFPCLWWIHKGRNWLLKSSCISKVSQLFVLLSLLYHVSLMSAGSKFNTEMRPLSVWNSCDHISFTQMRSTWNGPSIIYDLDLIQASMIYTYKYLPF